MWCSTLITGFYRGTVLFKVFFMVLWLLFTSSAGFALDGPNSSTTGIFTLTYSGANNNPNPLRYEFNSHINAKLGNSSIRFGLSGTSTRREVSVTSAGLWVFEHYRVKYVQCDPNEFCTCDAGTGICYKPGVPFLVDTHSVTVIPPPVPSAFTYISQSDSGSFVIDWSSVTGANTYRLERRVVGRSWSEIYAGSSRRFNEAGIGEGQYEYRVRACNNDICSGFKYNGQVHVAYPPPIPNSLTVDDYSADGRARITWNGASQDEGLAVRYDLFRRNITTNSSWTMVFNQSNLGATDMVFSDSGLLHNNNYQYQIRACTYGCSSYNQSNTLFVEYVPPSISLNAPTNSSTGIFIVSWSQHVYAVTYQLQETGPRGTQNYLATSNTSRTITGADTNGSYAFSVRGCNSRGVCSPWSGTQTTVVNIALPQPVNLAVQPAILLNGESAVVSWQGNGNHPVRYEIKRNTETNYADAGTATDFTINGLPLGNYTYLVRACSTVNAGVCSAASESPVVSSIYPPENAPVPEVGQVSVDNYCVAWNTTAGANRYELQQKIAEGSWISVYEGSANEYCYIQSGDVDIYGLHRYRLIAKNEAGASPLSVEGTTVFMSGIINLSASPQLTLNDASSTLRWETQANQPVNYVLRYPDGRLRNLGNVSDFSVSDLSHGENIFKLQSCSSLPGYETACTDFADAEVTITRIMAPEDDSSFVLEVPASADPGMLSYNVNWTEALRATDYVLQFSLNDGDFMDICISKIDSNYPSNTGTDDDLEECSGETGHTIIFDTIDEPYGTHYFQLIASNLAGAVVSEIAEVRVEVDPTDYIRKSLYYNEADMIPLEEDLPEQNRFARDAAAFRYLDLSYVLDPETNSVIYQFGEGVLANRFESLYDDQERIRVDNARLKIIEEMIKFPDNSNLERFLLDVYFDQALAEIIAGNQILDQARILRLRDSNIQNELNFYKEADIHFEHSMATYSELFDLYGDIVLVWEASRGDLSPRYRDVNDVAQNVSDEDRLYNGYKDVRVYYEMLAKWASSVISGSRLEVLGRQANTTLIEAIRNRISVVRNQMQSYDQNLRTLFTDTDFAELTGFTGVPEAYRHFQALLTELDDLYEVLIDEEINLIGLPQDAVLILFGQANNGQLENADSFDIIVGAHNPFNGTLKHALDKQKAAQLDFDNLKRYQDTMTTDFNDRMTVYNNRMADLIGLEFENCADDICTAAIDNAETGSAISLQNRAIEKATLEVQASELAMENALKAIEIEIERRGEAIGVSDAIEQVYIEYDRQQIAITQQMNDVRVKAEKSRQKAGIFKSITGIVSGFIGSNGAPFPVAGIVNGMSSLISQVASSKSSIKALQEKGRLEVLRQQLASEERAKIRALNQELLTIESEALIRNLWLQVKTAEINIAIAEANLDAEVERLTGMIVSAQRVALQANTLRENQGDRYFADPIHLQRLSASLINAEFSFSRAQEWMHYAVRALEYKWQEDFLSTSGKNAQSLMAMRGADELESFYHDMMEFNSIRSLRAFQENTDTISLKIHVLGYYDRIRGKVQCYPHPFPERRQEIDSILSISPFINECESVEDGSLLDARHAFRAYLGGSLIAVNSSFYEEWITLNFSSVKPIPRSQLFLSPRFVNITTENPCILSGGTYNDKILEVGVNIVNSGFNAEIETPIRLSYGGTSYFRAKYVDENGEDIENRLDRMESIANRFWDVAGADTLRYEQQMIAEMDAKIVTGNEANILHLPTSVFKERSVAATEWGLEILKEDDWGPLFDMNFVEDINLVIHHKYLTRNIDTCNESSSSINLLHEGYTPQLQHNDFSIFNLPEETLFFEEKLYLDSLK